MVVLVCVQAAAGMQFEWKGQRMQFRMLAISRLGVGYLEGESEKRTFKHK
jgi:hypothetical protein